MITVNFHLIFCGEISNFYWFSQACEQKTVLISNKSCKHLLGGSAISPNICLENKLNSVPFLPWGKPYWGDFWGRAICFYSSHFLFQKGTLSLFVTKCWGCPFMLMHDETLRLGNLHTNEMILWWNCMLDWYCPWMSLNLRQLLKGAVHVLLVLLPYQQGLKCLFLHTDVLPIIFLMIWKILYVLLGLDSVFIRSNADELIL